MSAAELRCSRGVMIDIMNFLYLATASLYTKPAVARLTTSKHKSEPSILKKKRNIYIYIKNAEISDGRSMNSL